MQNGPFESEKELGNWPKIVVVLDGPRAALLCLLRPPELLVFDFDFLGRGVLRVPTCVEWAWGLSHPPPYKGYSSTYVAMGYANVRAGTQTSSGVFGYPPAH